VSENDSSHTSGRCAPFLRLSKSKTWSRRSSIDGTWKDSRRTGGLRRGETCRLPTVSPLTVWQEPGTQFLDANHGDRLPRFKVHHRWLG
jgi:hypothetical protein